jgi:hypothetical protein
MGQEYEETLTPRNLRASPTHQTKDCMLRVHPIGDMGAPGKDLGIVTCICRTQSWLRRDYKAGSRSMAPSNTETTTWRISF